MKDIIELEDKYEMGFFPKRNIAIVKGKDATLWDAEGNEYIDCVSGHGVSNIGHCNENLINAIKKQSEKLITCPAIFYNDVRAKLCEKLVEISPSDLSKVFLCNSGTEATEAAIKFARIASGKTKIICAMKGYHGRTFGSLSATFKKDFKIGMGPMLPGFEFVPFNNIEKLKEKIDSDTCAIMLEVIQGEGGINIGKKEYFDEVKNICSEQGILLIIDEVQTGFCRTGKMFACEHFDIQPDILCAAKALGGGIPIGAVLCSEKIEIPKGKHGTTFGGNPLASACALAAIDFMEEKKLAARANELGEYFVDNFKASERVREVRQIGLMIAIELKEKSTPYIQKLLEEKILTLPAGSTAIRLLPPLVITKEQVGIVIEKLHKVLS